jgi:hypothetical protein
MTRVRLAVLAIAVLLGLFGVTQTPAFVAALAQCNYAPGSVVQLVNTPHLFINDDVGVNLHWGGDTRALQGKTIQWSNTCNLGLPALEATTRGDPWLSAGLPQVGEVIYQAKWETEEPQPTLLRIRTIDDVELFGIQSANYLTFVLDQATWQSRYGFQMGNLQVGPLASSASFEWSTQDQQNYNQLLLNMKNVESASLFQATSTGVASSTSLPAIADCEEMGLDNWDATRNPSTALSTTQNCLNQLPWGTAPAPAVPTAPTNLRLTPVGPNSIRLDWTDASNNEQGFRVARNDDLLATLGPNVTTYTDNGWNPNALSCYQVAAFNSAGFSATPDVCTGAVPNLTPPAPPTNLRLTPEGNAIRLSWIDNSTNEDGFRIVRGGVGIGTVGPNVTTYLDTTWNPAVLNCYQVVAFNNAGVGRSAQVCGGGAGPAQPIATPPVGPAQPIATPPIGPALPIATPPLQPIQPLPQPPLQPIQPLPEPPLQPIQPLPEPPLQPIQPLPEPPEPVQPLPDPDEPMVTPF